MSDDCLNHQNGIWCDQCIEKAPLVDRLREHVAQLEKQDRERSGYHLHEIALRCEEVDENEKLASLLADFLPVLLAVKVEAVAEELLILRQQEDDGQEKHYALVGRAESARRDATANRAAAVDDVVSGAWQRLEEWVKSMVE